jgi:pimeloyl-ACP methyl ester carboxylesterase
VTEATLLTIHGLFSSSGTWDKLAGVWRADEDLRFLQIRPFDYRSPKKSWVPFSTSRVPDYDDVAQVLATEYATVLQDASDIAIVSHSQGGLVLQRFLEWMLSHGRGRELLRIRTVIMLACPNGGSEYLRSVRHAVGLGRHPQVGSLDVLDRRVGDTQRRVLDDIVRADCVDDHHCRIPFHVYAGDSDTIVRPASAQSAFPGASTLAGDHSSILDPGAPGNRTAEIVKHHILADFAAARPAPCANAPAAGRPDARAPESGGHGARPKYVVNIGDGAEGLMIGDGGIQHNDFRHPHRD